MREEKCCAGCKRFTGDETYHIPECYFYEESMSRMYDEACEELKLLKDKYRWRKASEELPDIGLRVLLKDDSGVAHLGYIDTAGDWRYCLNSELIKNDIIVWKPIN